MMSSARQGLVLFAVTTLFVLPQSPSRAVAEDGPGVIAPPIPRQAADGSPEAGLPAFSAVSESVFANEQPFEQSNLLIGYDEGFVIANRSDNQVSADNFPFLLRMNSWFQLRHTVLESDGPNADQNTFSFERLRLSFSGHAFDPDLSYFFQFDGNSDRFTESIFLDYFIQYDLGRNVFGSRENRLGIKAGKWKVPFSRSRDESGRQLQFTDRSTANVFFDLNRSIGAGLFGEVDPLGLPIQWETALFNGFQTGSVSTSRNLGLDRNFGWSLRALSDLFGQFGGDGEPDLSYHESPALRVGSGFAVTRVEAAGGIEFNRQRGVDSGETLGSLLPAGVDAYDVSFFTLDSHFKYRGFSIIYEYYWRHLSQFRGAQLPGLTDHGFNLQSGYFVCPEKLELLLRWSRIVGDSGTLGLMQQSSDEVAAGVAWYLRGNNAKLVFDVTNLNGVPINSSRLDMLPGDAGWLMRTQFQLAF